MNITAMAYKVHQNACSKGWWGDKDPIHSWDESTLPAAGLPDIEGLLALVHSEISEALECVRSGHFTTTAANGGKPEGFPSELADVVIRIFDIASGYGRDIEGALVAQMIGATDKDAFSPSAIRSMVNSGHISMSISDCVKFCAGRDEVLDIAAPGQAVKIGSTLFRIHRAISKYEEGNLNEVLANTLVGVFFLAGKYGIDIEKEVELKHEFNLTRDFKHGGKRL